MIALYSGISMTSRLIRCWHRDFFSHASEIADDFSVEVEAYQDKGRWLKGRVQEVCPFSLHTSGTHVHLYEMVKPFTVGEREAMWHFLRLQVGKPYDIAGLLGFLLLRERAGEGQDAWFCSELVSAAYQHIKRPLLQRVKPHKVYPSMLSYSPEIRLVRIAVVP